ncbi:major capsid protein [Sodalis sp. RH19]|uniref:major capsid protein n=1 Tax=Sodalis sp. RH19 TaxID=3394334 RepID=UPI0039B60085
MLNLKDNEVIDLGTSYEGYDFENNLLINSGLFNPIPETSTSVAFDTLMNTTPGALDALARYGAAWNNVKRDKFSTHYLPIPTFPVVGSVTAQSFQSRRAFGTEAEDLLSTAIANEQFRQAQAVNETKEKSFGSSLFHNQVIGENAIVLVDLAAEFGFTQQTATVDLSSSTVNPVSAMSDIVGDAREQIAGSLKAVTGFMVVCSPSFFKALKNSTFVLNMAQYSLVDRDVAFPSNLPAYRRFSVDGVTYVEDLSLASHGIADGDAYMFPTFSQKNEANPYRYVYGPCSRNIAYAASLAPQQIFQWAVARMASVEVYAEAGILALNTRPDFVTKITNTAA